MPASPVCRLLVPGLLGPVADPDAVTRLLPALPETQRIIARAERRADGVADGEGTLCAAFGVAGPPWPVAAAARLGEAEPPATEGGYWVRCDPVHLRVDTDHARLFGPYVLGLERDAADELVGRINEQLGGDGPALEAPDPGRWYLRLDEPPGLESHALPVVAGRNVNAFLPSGERAPAWRTWLTEVQMVLHDAPANQARERAGRLPVNSLWPWGEGASPAHAAGPDRVWSDEPLAAGLARLAEVPAQAAPDSAPGDDWPAGTTLVADFSAREPLVHGEIEGWLEAVDRIERHWCAPLLAALRAGRLQRIELDPCDGRRFVLTRAGRLRGWRRERAWTDWLAAE